jgi:hypothetical protein
MKNFSNFSKKLAAREALLSSIALLKAFLLSLRGPLGAAAISIFRALRLLRFARNDTKHHLFNRAIIYLYRRRLCCIGNAEKNKIFENFLGFFEKKCNKTAGQVHLEVKAEGKLPFALRKIIKIWEVLCLTIERFLV